MWWLIPLLIGGAVVVRRRSLGAPLPGPGGTPGKIGGGDGSKAHPIRGVTKGVTDPGTLKGKWYLFSDGTGPWYFPTDADQQAFMRSIVSAVTHNHRPPNPPAEWGQFTGWHTSAGFAKITKLAGAAVGAGAGFVTGGPAGAKTGWQAGQVIANKVFVS